MSISVRRSLLGASFLFACLVSGAALAQSLSLLDARVVEGNTGTSALLFEARLSAPATGPVTFNFDVSDGTATAGSDYTDVSLVGVLSIPAGQTSLKISVPVTGDTTIEPDEYVNANISGIVGATLADGTAKGLIINDDNKMLVSGPFDPGASNGSNGNAQAYPAISRDGRYVAFVSNATDLVAGGPGNGLNNIYVRDTRTGVTVLATPAVDGGVANSGSFNPSLSADGRYLVFESDASNLVANDTNGVGDVFQRDLLLGTTVLVSVAANGSGPGNLASMNPAISADGLHVSFDSNASNLVAVDGNNKVDVFVRDMQAGITRLVSVEEDGVSSAASGASDSSISGDGRYVVFTADALVPEDTWQYNDIYMRDMQLGVTTRISVAGNGGNPDSVSYTPVISENGRYVVFQSTSTNLGGPVPVNLGAGQLYVRDVQAGTTKLVSYDTTGTKTLDTIASDPSISADGRFVSFRTMSKATTDDVDSFADIFVRDLQANKTTLISKTWNGSSDTEETTGTSVISGDGHFVAFESSSPAMLPGDGNGQGDVFRAEMTQDPTLPVLSIPDLQIQEGDVGKQLLVTVSLSAPTTQNVYFDLATADGTAQAGSDYTGQDLTGLVIGAGKTSRTIMIAIGGDDVYEPDEVFNIYTSHVVGARLVDDQALETIVNDDTASVVPALSIADVSLSEGNSGTKTMTFTVSLSAPTTNPVVFDIATSNGTATAGSDYVAMSLTGQTIAAGQTSKQFSVTINGDTAREMDETFTVTVSNVGAATVTDGVAIGKIVNDDAGPVLSVNDVSIAEGNSGTKLATFTVSLSAVPSNAVTFDIATANGTAVAGSDYMAKATTGVVIAAGTTSTTFTVTINGDTAGEADETFKVNISNALGAGLADAQGIGTITNDDTPALSIGDVSISEGQSGTKLATFTVQLSDIAAWPVSFDAATANGTATAGSDYVALALTGQTIAAGQTSKAVSVTINGDTVFEPNETFAVNVTNVAGATVTDGQATGTILDDDEPTLSISDARVVEGNSGTAQLGFRVSLSAPEAGNVSFRLTTSDGSATAAGDYTAIAGATYSIPAGQTSVVVNVAVTGDTTVEGIENMFASVDQLVNALPGDVSAIGQILNDDGTVLVSVSKDASQPFANGGGQMPAITPDGRYVAFESAAENLVDPIPGVRYGYNVYVRDMISGTITRASVPLDGGYPNDSSEFPSISDDGRYVVFVSRASNLVANDTNGNYDVFRRDLQTGVTEMVSVRVDGIDDANGSNLGAPLISGNGRYVAFEGAGNLIASAPNGGIMIRDMLTGVTSLGAPLVDPSQEGGGTVSGISRDGRYITFDSNGGGYVGGDTACAYYSFDGNPQTWPCRQAYWRDTVAGVTKIVNTDSNGVPVHLSWNYAASISADGRWVGFKSDMIDRNQPLQAFVRDMNQGKTYVASIGPDGQPGNAPSSGGYVSPDGTQVAFISKASNLVGNDINGTQDVFLKSIATATPLTRVTIAADGISQSNGDAYEVRLSDNAQHIAFSSTATNLILGGRNSSGEDVFVTGVPCALSIDDVSVFEGNSGIKLATFTVRLSQESTSDVTFDIATASGSATSGIDFGANSSTGLTIPAGAMSRTFTVKIIGDTAIESDETFLVNVTNVVGMGVSVADPQAIGTILDDDATTLHNGIPVTVPELGAGHWKFYSLVVPAGATGLSFDLSGGNGDADIYAKYGSLPLSNLDCVSASAAPSEHCAIANVQAGTYYVMVYAYTDISNVSLVGQYSGGATALTIGDVAVTEGNNGSKTMAFKVSLSAPASTAVTYNIATANGTAINGSDYVYSSLTNQSIPAGQTSKTFNVTINGDTTVEANEAFSVNITNVTGAVVANSQAYGAIINDDGPVLSIGDISVLEGNGNGGPDSAIFTVRLSQPAAVPVTYNINTADGSAKDGYQYFHKFLTGETIPAGQTSKTFTVQIIGDVVPEPNQTFFANVSAVNGATVLDGTAIGYIINDDGPTLSVGDATISEGNSGTKTLTFTVSLSQAATSTVTYDIATSDGTATAGSDYAAVTSTPQSIPAGQTSKTFSVTINGDTTVEPDETFYLNLSNPVGATKFDGTGVGTISNDDGAALRVAMVDTGGLFDDIDDGNRAPLLSMKEYTLLLQDTAQRICQRAPTATIVAVDDVENRSVLGDLADAVNVICNTQPHYAVVMVQGDSRGFLIDVPTTPNTRGPQVLGPPETFTDADSTALSVLGAGQDRPITVLLASAAEGTPAVRRAHAQALAQRVQQRLAQDANANMIVLGANAVNGLVDLTVRAPLPANLRGTALPNDRILVSPALLRQFKAHTGFVPLPTTDEPAQYLQLQQ
jgi:hypothetical protein